MNFVAVWLFFLCTVVSAKQHRGKVVDYLGLNKTVFVYSGKYFVELDLEQNGSLSVAQLKRHCPSVTKLVANSMHHQFPIIENTKFVKKLPNEEFEDIFDFYHCVYDPRSTTTIPPETNFLSFEIEETSGENQHNVWTAIKMLKHQARINKEEALQRDNVNKADRMRLQLKIEKLSLVEAAVLLLQSLGRDPSDTKYSPATPDPTETDEFHKFLYVMREKKNFLGHDFGRTMCENDSKVIMKKEIQRVLEAYRYLVCTNNTDLTIGCLEPQNAKSLLYFEHDFQLSGSTAVNLILKILGYQDQSLR